MIHVVAIIATHPGKRAKVLAAYEDNLAAVRAEAGCIEYGPLIDDPASPAPYGGDTIVVAGKWESVDHLKAHGARPPHMAAFYAKIDPLVVSRVLHIPRAP